MRLGSSLEVVAVFCFIFYFLPLAGLNKLAVTSKARAMNATCKCLALDKDDYDVDDIWVEFKKKRGMRTANKTNATHPARAAVALSVASVDPASGPIGTEGTSGDPTAGLDSLHHARGWE